MISRRFLFHNKSLSVFLLSLFVSIYWFGAQVINVYRFPVAGAIYELSSVVMIIMLFGLPVFSFIHWVKNKFDPRSLYFYSFLILIISIVVLFTGFS